MTKFRVKIDDRVYQVEVEEIGETAAVQSKPAVNDGNQKQKVDGTEVKAPLTGNIVSVMVKVGDRVKAGDVLLTLEALKLENEITAPVSGTVVQIANPGDFVETDQVLAIIR